MLLRRVTKLLVALGCAIVLVAWLLPVVFERRAENRLAALGFTHASVDHASVGLDRAVLHGVRVDDVDVGTIELEPGLPLLWRSADRIRIPDARASEAGMRDAVQALAKPRPKHDDKREEPASLDISISVRDPSRGGWRGKANGKLVIGDGVRVERGRIEVVMPKASKGGVAASKLKMTADVAGSVSARDLRIRGSVRAARIDTGELAMTDVHVPFAYRSAGGVELGRGTAALFGGTIEIEPFRPGAKRIVLRGRSLRLDQLTSSAVQVTGIVDGTLALRLGTDGTPVLERGELRARAPGTLRVRKPEWRAQLARLEKQAAGEAVATALLDFRYSKLAATLAPPGAAHELSLSVAGTGTNKQALELVVRVNGARNLVARWLGKEL